MDATFARRRQRGVLGAAVLALLVGASGSAAADSGRIWRSVAVFGGVLQWDPHLADYQWDVSPRPTWGVEARAGRGPWGGGLRLWTGGTTQTLDAPSGTAADVRALGGEAVVRARFAKGWGTRAYAVASVGGLRLEYDPDRVAIPGGASGSIEVELEPVRAWTGGAGVAFQRDVVGPWSAGLELAYRSFAIESVHREGSAIVKGREWFGSWTARLELSRGWGRP